MEMMPGYAHRGSMATSSVYKCTIYNT